MTPSDNYRREAASARSLEDSVELLAQVVGSPGQSGSCLTVKTPWPGDPHVP